MAVNIPLKYLKKYCNPFKQSPWQTSVSREDVQKALDTNRLASKPGGKDHAARIAYLVKNPAQDHIFIDVGVPSLGYSIGWMVTDGNHRLAAKIFKREAFILAAVDGELDYAKFLFKVDCSE